MTTPTTPSSPVPTETAMAAAREILSNERINDLFPSAPVPTLNILAAIVQRHFSASLASVQGERNVPSSTNLPDEIDAGLQRLARSPVMMSMEKWSVFVNAIHAQNAECITLRADLAAKGEDSARLDWLELHGAGLNDVKGGHVWVPNGDDEPFNVDHFYAKGYRAAIDRAALRAAPTNEGGKTK